MNRKRERGVRAALGAIQGHTGESIEHVKSHWDSACDERQAAERARCYDAEKSEQALMVLLGRLEGGDGGAPFEPEAAAMITNIRRYDEALWQRYRNSFKKHISITALEKNLKGDYGGNKKESVVDSLTEMAIERCDLFFDGEGTAYASFERGGHTETWRVESRSFKDCLISWYYQAFDGNSPTKVALEQVTANLSGHARVGEGAEERAVARRCAFFDGCYYIDLCNDDWSVVEVDQKGWRVVSESPIPFIRSSTCRALPVPSDEGDIAPLWLLVNIPEKLRLLYLTAILDCYRPNTNYPVIVYVGEEGSAKSSTHSMTREFVDPNVENLRTASNTRQDLFVQANNNYVVSLENISHLTPTMQDALCSLSTGGGSGARGLYTDGDEYLISIQRPVMLNGISYAVTQSDLLSRALLLELPRLAGQIKTDADIKSLYEEHKNTIFGGLLDLFSQSLARLPNISISPEEVPRMADYAYLGEAVAQALGAKRPGSFVKVYKQAKKADLDVIIDSSPVLGAVVTYMREKPEGFEGTPGELFAMLIDDDKGGGQSWPKSAKGFGDAMRKGARALRSLGLEYVKGRRANRGQLYTLRYINDEFRYSAEAEKAAKKKREAEKLSDARKQDQKALLRE